MKNKDISNLLNTSETLVSRLLTGRRKVSWPLAEKLSELFPSKNIKDWKRATPKELKRAFEQLKEPVNNGK